MRLPQRHSRARTAIAAIAAMTCLTLSTGSGAAALPGSRAPVPTPTPTSTAALEQVTLLTGDRVTLLPRAGRSPQVTVAAGPGRSHVPIVTMLRNRHIFVEPADARRLVTAGRLDERLFDVTQLLAWKYDDRHRSSVPVIAQRAAGLLPQALPGAVTSRNMQTLAMTSLRIDKAHATLAWRYLVEPGTNSFRLDSGVRRLWLDGQRELRDDRSREQIGVPVAERIGLSGAGVEVAVLDSGYDPTHPDLSGRVNQSRGFTDAGARDLTDRFGHGTHVASILAGSGAASAGRYRGVAVGAKLAIGKVCDVVCADSAILAGMQWAAIDVKARIVNMSLGGTDGPEIDPLEQAVDTLTNRTGTLFVIAAGNSGPFEKSVDSPGSADAALTVGAVDATDTLADFSSRGPRQEGATIKPDLTAPGVDIVAARAAGTTLGDPVGTGYIKLSGTSMATPHVAGAAALLAQQHPTWRASQLKAALVSSATPGVDRNVYDEGTGRVDVARAVTAVVTSIPGSLPAADLAWPHHSGQQIVRSYAYTNDSATQQTLHLSVTGGPAGLFDLSTTELTLAASESKNVTITTHGAGAPVGRYSALITATTPDGKVAADTAIAAEVEPEILSLGVTALDRAGHLSAVDAYVFDTATGEVQSLALTGGTGAIRLPVGHYDVLATIPTHGRAGTSESLVVRPFQLASGNEQVTLDARAARPVDVAVDRPDAAGTVDTLISDTSASGNFAVLDVHSDAGLTYATPVPATRISFGVASTWQRSGATPQRPSPYRYDVTSLAHGGIPARLNYRYRRDQLVAVRTTYRSLDATTYGKQVRLFDPLGFGIGGDAGQLMRLPATVTAYLTSGVTYTTVFSHGPKPDADDLERSQVITIGRTYRRGHYREIYNAAAIGPSFPYERDVRERNLMGFTPFSFFTDAGPISDQHSGGDFSASGTATLRRDGVLTDTWRVEQGKYVATVPDKESTYTFTLSATTSPADTPLSSRVTAVYTFRSGYTRLTLLPLLAVRYSVPGLDDQNRARARRIVAIPVQVVRNPDNRTPTVRALTIQASIDDGASWHKVSVRRAGSRWLAVLTNPGRPGFVSLRATATDVDGNSVTQTIIHAYAVRS